MLHDFATSDSINLPRPDGGVETVHARCASQVVASQAEKGSNIVFNLLRPNGGVETMYARCASGWRTQVALCRREIHVCEDGSARSGPRCLPGSCPQEPTMKSCCRLRSIWITVRDAGADMTDAARQQCSE